MIDCHTGDWAREMVAELGLPTNILGPITAPATVIGKLRSILGSFSEKNVLWYRQGKSSPDFTIASGSLWANPAFANWGSDDYRLTASSAALNRGVSTSIVPSFDLGLNLRLTGGALDLGAFEFASANQPPVLTAPSSHALIVARALLVLGFALTFYPIVKGFTLGQIQVWLNGLFALSIVCWATGWKASSGVLIGLM